MRSSAFALLFCTTALFAAERHTVFFHGERLQIVDRSGLALWEGDIVLGRTEDLLEATRLADLAGTASRSKGLGLGAAGGRWPKGASGLFELPYVIENDPDGGVPPAIVEFNLQLAGFARAVARGAEPDYVAFNFDSADTTGPCFSSVGRVGGRQAIAGARNCSVARLLHEMGHALGLYHEQERTDRLKWVTVAFDLVDPWLAYNYVQNLGAGDIGSYDYGAIMHYGPMGFTKTGANILETIPPGIDIGPSGVYSRGDLDSLHRLYGLFDPAIVVDTYPSGLTVLVDGVSRTTPATVNWPLGSTHTLAVPAGAQVLGGVVHVFARWSSDSAGTLASSQTITVAPGAGTLTQPSQYPATSLYTANFVRMKAVTLGTQGNQAGVGGSVAANPPPAPVPGVSGNYYRERQPFTLTPTANAGSTFGRWRGSFAQNTTTSTLYASQMRGPLAWSDTIAAYVFNAYFVDFPFATLRARAQGVDIFGISATVARTGGTTTQRMPYNTTDTTTPWAAGESGTVTVPQTAIPYASSVRYVLNDINGNASPTATLTHPAAGQASTTLVANYKKQYEPYTHVSPSCAGSIAVGANPDGWVDAGATIPVTLTATAGWTLARWSGSLTGTGNSRSLTASDVPDLNAEMNIVAVPLAVTSVSPPSVASGRAVTLEIFGQGFAPTSRVLVANVLKTPSAIGANRIAVPLSGSDYPATGKVVVTVQNRPPSGSCALNVSTTFETFVPAGSLDPALDSDGDGIPNGVESSIGTNPLARDNDLLAGSLLGAQLFSMQQYRDFLAREGDSGGVGFWANQVSTGTQTRAQVIESFFSSPEFQGTIAPVARLYFAYFLRIPDYAGLNFWIGYYRAGHSLDEISGFFAASPEFTSRYGSLNNTQFVTLVYNNVLGRAPDAPGLAFWKNELDTGNRTRGQVMLGFSESAEYRQTSDSEIYVTMMYFGMLRRAPDSGGFSFWVQYRDDGNSGLALIDGFLGSPEYRGRFLP